MNWKRIFTKHLIKVDALNILKYIGPGFLVTVGFIDPGNWASNVAAGSQYGYYLLWVVTISTIMLFILQRNAAHLGIVTGLCLSEASTKFFRRGASRLFLLTAILASVSTALAEVLGAAIGLNMLFGIPLTMGAVLSALFAGYVTFSKGYRMLERVIIGFVSLIGLSFIFELALVRIEWSEALRGWVTPSFPQGSLPIVMSILGAVVMPHNLFLHSEIIQSRQWNLEAEEVVKRQLKYEFTDTLFAMIMGWAINSAMILLAASVFYSSRVAVTNLPQAEMTLRPLLGNAAAFVFALALLFSGLSSSLTAAMAGGSIFAGIFEEPFDMSDNHSRAGVLITLLGGLLIVFFLKDPFQGIIWSQIILSIQLPWTIFSLLLLTSSQGVMGKFSNSFKDRVLLWSVAVVVSVLNVMLLVDIFQ